MGKILHLDYETRSTCDLKKCGLSVYAKDPTTDIWVAAYAFDDEPVKLWIPTEAPCPKEISDHILSRGLIYAHNAAFEIAITNFVAARKYSWPEISLGQVHCTMAMAFSMAIPGSLEKAAAALGIEKQKDMAGSRLMMQMSQPRSDDGDPNLRWWDEPEKIQRLSEYCIQDIEVERELTTRLLALTEKEQNLWILDQEINNRGVMVDLPAARHALAIVEQEKDRLDKKMREITNNEVASCKAVMQITRFVRENSDLPFAMAVDSIGKADVTMLLDRDDIPPLCKSVLLLRQEAAKSSTSKLEAMIYGADEDGRIRGCHQFYGATTGRWAGRRIQLQNLPRPKLSQEKIDEVLTRLSQSGITAEEIDLFYGPPLSVISDCLRGFLIAKEGHSLIGVDFSAIEARVLAWLAGEEWKLKVFRGDGKIYEHVAAGIYRTDASRITKEQRQIGKVAELALGYQGGSAAFQIMAKNYGIKVSDGEAKSIKYAWRDSNPRIVEYWGCLENSARSAILNPGQKFKAGAEKREITFLVKGSFLFCRLPSSRVLCYPYPKIQTVETPWGASKEGVTFMTENSKTRKWGREKTYGGSLAENCTQAVARDLLAEAMLRLKAADVDIVMHVHDEVVCEVESSEPEIVAQITSIIEKVPEWATDLPIAADGWTAKRYQK